MAAGEPGAARCPAGTPYGTGAILWCGTGTTLANTAVPPTATAHAATTSARRAVLCGLASLVTWTNIAAAATSPSSSRPLPGAAATSSSRARACWSAGAPGATPRPASSASALAASSPRRALRRGRNHMTEGEPTGDLIALHAARAGPRACAARGARRPAPCPGACRRSALPGPHQDPRSPAARSPPPGPAAGSRSARPRPR